MLWMAMDLTIQAFTLNCGNGTPGLATCKQLINELLYSKTQLMVLHCQETHVSHTLAQLRAAIGKKEIEILSSDPMVTHTSFKNQFHHQTGLITFILYKNDITVQLEPTQCIRRHDHRWQKGYNKGGILQKFGVQSGDQWYHIASINGHLDAFNAQARQQDWMNLNNLFWKPCRTWDELADWAPDMVLAGWDANTRNSIKKLHHGRVSRNVWELSNRKDIKFMLQFPLGNHRESSVSTKSPQGDFSELLRRDPQRPHSAKGGMLDIVSYQDVQQILCKKSSSVQVHPARTVISPEADQPRDHCVIGSQQMVLHPQSSLARVRQLMATAIEKSHPVLARQILRSKEPDKSLLFTLYQQQRERIFAKRELINTSSVHQGFFVANRIYSPTPQKTELRLMEQKK